MTSTPREIDADEVRVGMLVEVTCPHVSWMINDPDGCSRGRVIKADALSFELDDGWAFPCEDMKITLLADAPTEDGNPVYDVDGVLVGYDPMESTPVADEYDWHKRAVSAERQVKALRDVAYDQHGELYRDRFQAQMAAGAELVEKYSEAQVLIRVLQGQRDRQEATLDKVREILKANRTPLDYCLWIALQRALDGEDA